MRNLLILFFLTLTSFCYGQNKQIRVACIGNSVTWGWGLKDPANNSYPSLLGKKMGAGFEVKNFGHSGATLLKKGHNPYYKTKVFRDMLQFAPDIAIIHLGLNDTDPRNFPHYRDEFIPDYNWLLDTIRKTNPQIKIYVCKLTPIFTGHSRFLSSTLTWYNDLQQRIETVARQNTLPVIDLNEALHNRPDLFPDPATLHPNEEGVAIIAHTVYQHLTGNFGGLWLPPVFADNMVLQRRQPLKIWGRANAGSSVTVKFMQFSQTVRADYNGKWQLNLPSSEAVAEPQVLEISNGSNKRILRNILIGDVWLCSGQSNMYFPLSQSAGGDSLIRKADPDQPLRLLKYRPFAETDNREWSQQALKRANELDFFSGNWQLNSKEAAAGFSAVGYIFGARILKEEKVPVGLIEISVGGSPLISWVSRHTLESNPLFTPAFKNWRQSDYIMQWCRDRADLNLKNAASPSQRHSYEPSYNFEAALEKLIPFSLTGVAWYQGESDAENAELFQQLFPLFVKDWRQQWGKELPFYYVQLSSIERPSWNYFRDVQRRLLETVPRSGMAVTSDLGDPSDVHYKNKIPVGERLARLALHHTYRKNILPSGPLFLSATRSGNTIQVNFRYSKGLQTSGDQPLTGFEIETQKGEFIPAKATIKNNRVIVELPPGVSAYKIAYAWRPYTRANLVNKDQLPASTFIASVK